MRTGHVACRATYSETLPITSRLNRPRLCAPDEDHVDALCLRCGHDGFTGGAGPHEKIDLHTEVSAALDQPLCHGLATVTHLVYANAEPTPREDQVVGVDHANDEQHRVIPVRQFECPLGGEVGRRREVGGEQDPPQRQRRSGAGGGVVRRGHPPECHVLRPSRVVTFGPIWRAACPARR